MTRSLSITIIAIFQALVSSLSLISGGFLILLSTGVIQVLSRDLTELPPYLKGLVALGFAISLFGLVVSYGLWTLRRWGWIGSLIFQVGCIANNGLAVWAGQPLTAGVYFSLALCLAFIVALLTPTVRQSFAVEPSESDTLAS